jgi:hypothetical protein
VIERNRPLLERFGAQALAAAAGVAGLDRLSGWE